MEKAEFKVCCEAFCERLKADAHRWYPEWETHPGGKIKPPGTFRYELNKTLTRREIGTLYSQYILMPDVIAIGVYLTRLLGPMADDARQALEHNRDLIECEVGPNSAWGGPDSAWASRPMDEQHRFYIPVNVPGGDLTDRGKWDRLVPGLVGMMRRFQETVFPLIGF